MKKLVSNFIGFILPVIFIYVIIVLFPSNKKNTEYTCAIIDKVKLISLHKFPSTIIIGGSNVVFGIDSKMIKDSIGCEIINVGLQASLGIVYQLDLCKKYAKPGDVILLIPEYYQYLNDDYYGTGSTLAKVIQLSDPFQIFELQSKMVRNVIPFLFPESVHKLNSYFSSSGGNERLSFNEYGDFIGHLKMKNRTKSKLFENYILQGKLKPTTFNKLADYFYYFKSRNISFYVSYPSFPNTLTKLNHSRLDSITKMLSFKKIPQLGDPENATFSDSLFFEYPNHLNAYGRMCRTKMLINFLKEAKLPEHFSKYKIY